MLAHSWRNAGKEIFFLANSSCMGSISMEYLNEKLGSWQIRGNEKKGKVQFPGCFTLHGPFSFLHWL